MPRKRGDHGTRPPLRSSEKGMARAFGTWFLDYPGSDDVLLQLQIHWESHLANDYLPSHAFKTADDVAVTLKRGFADEAYIEAQVHRAWAEFIQETEPA